MHALHRIRPFASTGFALALAAVYSMAWAACTTDPQLSDPTYLTANLNPVQVVIGDFNEDGISDLAAAVSQLAASSGNGAHVAIYLGNGSGGVGNGTFQSDVNYPTGRGCFGIVVGDFNEDGIQDLATSNFSVNSVSILLGQGSGGVGNGTFAAAVDYPAGPGAWHLDTGDFNEDGITDLAVSNNSQATVTILRGLGSGGVGNGTFALDSTCPLTGFGTDIQVADVNEDGISDILVAVPTSGKVQVLLGLGSAGVGNGTFASAVGYAAGFEPYDIDVADLDSDGILDLVAANGTSDGLRVMKGLGSAGVGNGAFGTPSLVAAGNVAIAKAADIDQDGDLDLLSGRNDLTPNPVLLVLGHGDGTFDAPKQFPVGNILVGMAIGNFDGSPKPDIALCSYSDHRIAVMRGTCGSLSKPQIVKVRDVPNDQGGKVFVTWTASTLDVPGGPVTSYRVWRRIPGELALQRWATGAGASVRSRREQGADPAAAAVTFWEGAAVMPAQRLPAYGYTSATPQDSMASGNPYTAFFITAATNNIDLFYDSDVDSGYSVDNLPPGPPQNLAVNVTPTQLVITWLANGEQDLLGYRLHRGSSSNFVPSASNLVAAIAGTETQFVDAQSPNLYYKLIALDVHGNPSTASLAVVAGPTAVTVTTSEPVLSDGGVELAWRLGESVPVEIERSNGPVWETRAKLTPGSDGVIRWTDHDVVRGTAYSWRLRLPGDTYAGVVSLTAPAFEFALDGVTPNPATSGSFGIRFRLADRDPATLEVLDVSGRRLLASRVESFGPGQHLFAVDRLQRLPAGIYLVRLVSGARLATLKAVLMR